MVKSFWSRFHGFSGAAIFAIQTCFGDKVLLQLSLHGGFGELFDKRSKDATLAVEIFALTPRLDSGLHIEIDFIAHTSSIFV
jgi:hypothetical protein